MRDLSTPVRLSRTQKAIQLRGSFDESIIRELDAYEKGRAEEEFDEEARANLVEVITVVHQLLREAHAQLLHMRDEYSGLLVQHYAVHDPELRKEWNENHGTDESFWIGVRPLSRFKEEDLVEALRILDGALFGLREHPLDAALWR